MGCLVTSSRSWVGIIFECSLLTLSNSAGQPAGYEAYCVPCIKQAKPAACDTFTSLVGSFDGSRKIGHFDEVVRYIIALPETSSRYISPPTVFQKFWPHFLKSDQQFLEMAIRSFPDTDILLISRLLMLQTVEKIMFEARFSGTDGTGKPLLGMMDSVAGIILSASHFDEEYKYKFVYLDRLNDKLDLVSERITYQVDSVTTQSRLHKFKPVNTNTVYAVGSSGTVLKSSNRAETWSPLSTGLSSTFVGADFLDELEGWIVDNSETILRTSDGGLTWSLVDGPKGGLIYGVKLFSRSEGLVYGFRVDGTNCILRFSEAGKKWEPAEAPNENDLYDMHFIDGERGWAVGTRGTILATLDGGRKWVKQDSIVSHLLRSVRFTDATHGWIIGDRGSLLRTGDGGHSWVKQPKIFHGNFTGIDFHDTKNGVLVGEPNAVFLTEDGGNSWKQEAIELGNNLGSVALLGPNFGLMTTPRNHIIRFSSRSSGIRSRFAKSVVSEGFSRGAEVGFLQGLNLVDALGRTIRLEERSARPAVFLHNQRRSWGKPCKS